MARFQEVTRESLSPEGQAAWDSIVGSRGSVRGPFRVLMAVPQIAGRVGAVGEYLRYGGILKGADRELGILVAARESSSRYEWLAHEPIGREEGTSDQAIEAVRSGAGVEGLTPREQVIIEVGRSLFRTKAVSDELFERAVAEFGREQVVELMTLFGYYGMLAFVLNGFEMPLPDDAPPTF